MIKYIFVLIKQNKKYSLLLVSLFLLVCITIGISIDLMFSIAREISHGQQQKQEVQTKNDLLQKIVTLEAKARSDDTNYAVHLELAKAYYGIGEVQKSKVEFFRAIDLSPEYNYDARYELVKMYLGLNDYQMAKTILYSIPSDNSERYNAIKSSILLQLAEFARDEYKFDDSIDFYELALSLYPEGSIEASRIKAELSFVYGMMADGYYNKNNLKKTVEYLNQSNSISPNAQSFFKLGMIAESQENLKGAAALYLKAYNLNQGEVSVDVVYNLISVLLKKYKDDLSLPELQTYYVMKRNLEERVGNEILLQNVQISNIKTYMAQNDDNSLSPVVSFQILNVSKKDIENLRARVIFLADGSVFSYKDLYIANKRKPLLKTSSTEQINVEPSVKFIDFHQNTEVRAFVFLSLSNKNDLWFLNKILIIPVK